MKGTIWCACTLLVLITSGCLGLDRSDALTGDFGGTIRHEEQHIGVIISMTQNWYGKHSATLTVPSQLLLDNVAKDCMIDGDSIRILFANGLNAELIGKIESQSITGFWKQGPARIPIRLSKWNSSMNINKYLRFGIEFAKKYSINTEQVDWVDLERSLATPLNQKADLLRLVPAFKAILLASNDIHGSLVIGSKRFAIDLPDEERVTKEFRTTASGHNLDLESMVIAKSIGYLRIPTTPSDQSLNDSFVHQVQNSLLELSHKGLNKFIIDLRLNEGGSMFALLAGLYPVLGEGTYGGFVGPKGRDEGTWMLKGGSFYLDENKIANGQNALVKDVESSKIAILVGPVTSSAAEAVTIALKGLPGKKIFGERTKGFVTAVSGIGLSEDATFFVSSKRLRNTRGEIFQSGVEPDYKVIGGDNFNDLQKDEKVVKAVEWLGN